MSNYKRITLVLPKDSKWDTEDLGVKAETLGMTKNEFMVKAIDLLYNMDTEVFKAIKDNAESLRVPEYIFIQNMIIDVLARSAAEFEVYGENKKRMLPQFMFVDDKEGFRTITGKELFDELVKTYKFDIKHNKK